MHSLRFNSRFRGNCVCLTRDDSVMATCAICFLLQAYVILAAVFSQICDFGAFKTRRKRQKVPKHVRLPIDASEGSKPASSGAFVRPEIVIGPSHFAHRPVPSVSTSLPQL